MVIYKMVVSLQGGNKEVLYYLSVFEIWSERCGLYFGGSSLKRGTYAIYEKKIKNRYILEKCL
jgi:hypothetical protein